MEGRWELDEKKDSWEPLLGNVELLSGTMRVGRRSAIADAVIIGT